MTGRKMILVFVVLGLLLLAAGYAEHASGIHVKRGQVRYSAGGGPLKMIAGGVILLAAGWALWKKRGRV